MLFSIIIMIILVTPWMALVSKNMQNVLENIVPSVVHGDVVNQLHDDDSLSYTCTTEESNLSSLGIRS